MNSNKILITPSITFLCLYPNKSSDSPVVFQLKSFYHLKKDPYFCPTIKLSPLQCCFMLDEWRADVRGMESTADHWVNRNACWLSVCSRTDARHPTPFSPHTQPFYIAGADHGTFTAMERALAQTQAKVQAASHRGELCGLLVIISISRHVVGAVYFPDQVFTTKKSTFPLVACLTLNKNVQKNIPMCTEPANQLWEYRVSYQPALWRITQCSSL